MSEPVSLALCYLAGYGALKAYSLGGTAVSLEAQGARQAATEVVERAELSQSLFGQKASAISQLFKLAAECSIEDWDGNGSEPINALAVMNAAKFVRSMPDNLPLPEFSPEPDGAVSLDWIESKTRFFTLSVGASDRLAYAWLDGTDKGHGVARFDGAIVPPRIIEEIKGTKGNGNTTLRAA